MSQLFHYFNIILFLFLVDISLKAQNCNSNEIDFQLILNQDNYPLETSWELFQNDSLIITGDTNSINLCLDTNHCYSFVIHDSYGDGICCGYGLGSYHLILNGDTIRSGGEFLYEQETNFNCPAGFYCSNAITINEGSYVAQPIDAWYVFSPDSTGVYQISTCGMNSCDTKIWVYDTCLFNIDSTNAGTIFYNDDNVNCLLEAELNGIMIIGQNYYIRVGDKNNSCNDTLYWDIQYYSPIYGCLDTNSCNYNPLATVLDTCYAYGDTMCPQPDLWLLEHELVNSLQIDTLTNMDPCTINEGCLKGFGEREILRFTTWIKNIGNADYYIGTPSAQPGQFDYDNCHQHFHYAGYARYDLYDNLGNQLPLGFKNGFCVMDLECADGGAQKYGCSNMGISADCGDIYSASLDCQWIDVTELDTGNYILVTKVNWDSAPDALGKYEISYDNNFAQACFYLDRDNFGNVSVLLDTNCAPYIDCAGNPFGNTEVDCNGICGGTAIMGDLNANNVEDQNDAALYVSEILGNSLVPNSCNDLNADGNITVYDASLINSCVLHGLSHDHSGGAIHDHCSFPFGVKDIYDTIYLTLLGVNYTDQYVDVGIKSSNEDITAYEFNVSGLSILSVDNMIDVNIYPIQPNFSIGGSKVIGISYVDSAINRMNSYQHLCRINYFNLDGNDICIDSIIDVVNINHHTTTTIIENGCLNVASNFNYLSNPPEYKLIPNPSSEYVDISYNLYNNEDLLVQVQNSVGEIVYSKTSYNVNQGSINLDVSDFPSGIYMVSFQSLNEVKALKFIKN
jgi:hypothetical protein